MLWISSRIANAEYTLDICTVPSADKPCKLNCIVYWNTSFIVLIFLTVGTNSYCRWRLVAVNLRTRVVIADTTTDKSDGLMIYNDLTVGLHDCVAMYACHRNIVFHRVKETLLQVRVNSPGVRTTPLPISWKSPSNTCMLSKSSYNSPRWQYWRVAGTLAC